MANIDPLGRTSTSVYDADGRVVQTIDALGNVSSTIYDADGHVLAQVDALGHRTSTIYDADSRAIAQIDALGRTSTTVYDGDSRVIETIYALGGISTTIYDANNNAIFHLDPLARTSQTVYDALNRAIAQVDPLSNRTTTVYNADGNVIATIDPLGHTTTTAYDALNRVTKVTNPDGSITSYLYDADGNQTTVIDPNSHTTTSVFDADRRVVQTIDPLGHVTSTAYDAIGETSSITDATGRQNVFIHDADGELTQEKWYSTTGSLTATLTFTYDANGNKLTAAAQAGTYTFAYDALNRVSVVQGPNGTTQTNGYDAVGNKTLVQDSFGGTVTTSYDALNRITAVVQGGTGVVTMQDTRAYDAASQLTSEARLTGSGSTWTTIGLSTFAYDNDGRVTGETSTNGSGTVLVSYAYAYDAASRISRQIDNGALRTYSYDSASQVTADTGTGASYSYDANGNRTMTGYAVNAANEVTSDGTWTYAYDAVGNEISKTNISSGAYWSYTYNNWNQMTEAMEKSSSTGTVLYDIVYGYDAFGNVISRTTSGATTDYAYTITDMADGYTVNVNTLWAELTSGGSLTTRYLVVDGQDVARSTSSAAYWLLTDREGSVRNITDNTGAIVDSIVYTAFGGIQSETSSSVGGNLLYTGTWYDRTTGLYQMHWRSYDPNIGQWVSVDPLGFGGGDVNTRRYVGNDGVNGVDLSGLEDVPTLKTVESNFQKMLSELDRIAIELGEPKGSTFVKSERTAISNAIGRDLNNDNIRAQVIKGNGTDRAIAHVISKARGDLVEGSFFSFTYFSIDDRNKIKPGDYVLQEVSIVKTWTTSKGRVFDSNPIVIIEGFSFFPKMNRTLTDTHSIQSERVGAIKIPGIQLAENETVVSFEFSATVKYGIGTYDGQDMSNPSRANLYKLFFSSDNKDAVKAAIAKEKFKYKEQTYKTYFKVSSDGTWVMEDDSNGTKVKGKFDMVIK